MRQRHPKFPIIPALPRRWGWVALLLTLCLITPAPASTGFIQNHGQVDPSVLYYQPDTSANLYFIADGLTIDLQGFAIALRFARVGPEGRINARDNIVACERRSSLYNFYYGDDPSSWRTDISAFNKVAYRDLWPGVNIVFQNYPGGLSYTFDTEPGAVPSWPAFDYVGAVRITLYNDGSRRVDTTAGHLIDTPPAPGEITGTIVWNHDSSSGSPPGFRNNPDALTWSTYLGGSADDYGHALALNTSGQPIVAGSSSSTDFPTTAGAHADTPGGLWDLVVSKLDAPGENLLWSTYIGGGSYDITYDIALDSAGNPVLTGKTESADFPTTSGTYDETHHGFGDVFVLKLNDEDGSLQWSTFAGGEENELAFSLLLDASENPIIAGYTLSSDFPTTPGAYDESHNGDWDAFLFKLTAGGDALLWSTFFGGSNADRVYDTAMDVGENIYLTSWTTSRDLPVTSSAYDTTYNENEDVYVAKFGPDGDRLEWCTYLGGSDIERAYAIDTDSDGNPVVTGWVRSGDFPTTAGGYDETYNGDDDIFVTKLASTGDEILWSTFLGGPDGEISKDIAIDDHDNLLITGSTESIDFPTTQNAYDTTQNGSYDAFVTMLNAAGQDLLWSSFVGGGGWEESYDIALDPQGHPVVIGDTSSPGFPTTTGAYDEDHNGSTDIFITKLDLGNTSAVSPDQRPGPGAKIRIDITPNPASGPVTISFDLQQSERVSFSIYNVAGRLIRRLITDTPMSAGWQVIYWDGHGNDGTPVNTGLYVIRQTGDTVGSSTQRLILIAD